MKIFFASSSAISIPIAETLLTSNLVSGFISNPDKPQGRSSSLRSNDFAAWAEKVEVPIFKPINNQEILTLIDSQKIDLIITCAYGLFIKEPVLTAPKMGWLNIHFSLLPKYRGAAPAQRAIQNAEKQTGVTIFKIEEGLDTGPILKSIPFAIPNLVGARELLGKLAKITSSELPDLLSHIDDWIFTPQSGEVSHAPKITKDELRIDFNNSAETILRNSLAFEMNGGTYCLFRGEKLELVRFEIIEFELEPGELKTDTDLLVGTGTTALRIIELKASGKRTMNARNWLNGARLNNGEKFE